MIFFRFNKMYDIFRVHYHPASFIAGFQEYSKYKSANATKILLFQLMKKVRQAFSVRNICCTSLNSENKT